MRWTCGRLCWFYHAVYFFVGVPSHQRSNCHLEVEYNVEPVCRRYVYFVFATHHAFLCSIYACPLITNRDSSSRFIAFHRLSNTDEITWDDW